MLDPDLAVWERPDDGITHVACESAGEPQFTLLGPLEVRRNGRDYTPTAPKVLQVLAMLLLRPGKVVQSDTLITELWAGHPPRSVRTTMQTHVWQLRRHFETHGFVGGGRELVVTKPSGYLLRVDPGQVDIACFQQLTREGRVLYEQRRHTEAAASLRRALDLWVGPPLAGVVAGPVLSSYATNLWEQRRNAQRLRIQAEIDAGMHHDLIAELRTLVDTNPLDEGLNAQLMRVLTLNGRRIEALALYREFRTRLSSELGLEPCTELQELHYSLLSDRSA